MAGNVDAVAAIDAFIKEKTIDTTRSGWRTSLPKPPKVGFDASKSYFWVLETNHGKIKVKLLPAVAPMHASSTIYLTKLGFYDGLAFHRVIPGFMAQGGCPLGTGTGSPGYRFDGEFDRSVRHDKPGVLSMANASRHRRRRFLTTATPHLDGKHTVYAPRWRRDARSSSAARRAGGRAARDSQGDRRRVTKLNSRNKPKPAVRGGHFGDAETRFYELARPHLAAMKLGLRPTGRCLASRAWRTVSTRSRLISTSRRASQRRVPRHRSTARPRRRADPRRASVSSISSTLTYRSSRRSSSPAVAMPRAFRCPMSR
jgi:cyclophilin family peptidyl-prolyl cis-trans isomerase